MKAADLTSILEEEPIGIVISRGPRVEHTPTFFAYVWSADPEATEESGASKAA